ncbi:MAG: hypothetical protein KDD67_04040 [Ignavibacteriae bacterium]|nr:hypothetical protein [Candidatus Andersenbacteria bacterium]MCB0711482.1 hypothetical protein [Ignavibacteriota bacterium]MCB9217628.1 hypothetical protein [Ignavibacteria bacterium]
MISYIEQQAHIIHDGNHRCPTYGGRTIECRIRIIENRWNTIVVATDHSDSIYSSITLHTEELATTICDSFNIDRSRLIWIEHIPPRLEFGRREDMYDLVHFSCDSTNVFSHPHWSPLDEEEIEVLTDRLLRTLSVE